MRGQIYIRFWKALYQLDTPTGVTTSLLTILSYSFYKEFSNKCNKMGLVKVLDSVVVTKIKCVPFWLRSSLQDNVSFSLESLTLIYGTQV